MVLVARAPAAAWEVKRSRSGVIDNIEKKKSFVKHYSPATAADRRHASQSPETHQGRARTTEGAAARVLPSAMSVTICACLFPNGFCLDEKSLIPLT